MKSYEHRARDLTTTLSSSQDVGAQAKLPIIAKLLLVSMMIPVGFNLGPLALDALRLVQILIVVPLFTQLLSGKVGKINFVDLGLFAFVTWSALSIFVNNPDLALQFAGISSVEAVSSYLVGRVCIRNRESFIALCKWVGFLVAITLPLAMLESQTGKPIILDTIRSLGFRSHYDVYHPPRAGLWRSQVVFIHPIHYGLFASTAMPLVFVGLVRVIPTIRRLALSLVIVTCAFLSLSSGAILALVMQVILIGWAFIFRKLTRRWILLILICILSYILVDLLSNRTPFRVFMSYATFSSHNAYWRSIIFDWGVMNVLGSVENEVVGHPIFGRGLNDWSRPSFMFSGSMDNFWLLIAVRSGIPAFIFLTSAYLFLIVRVGLKDFESDYLLLDLRRAWVFLFVGLSFTLATVHIWSAVYSHTMLLLGAGVWFLSAEPRTASKTETAVNRSAAIDESRRTIYSRFELSKGRRL